MAVVRLKVLNGSCFVLAAGNDPFDPFGGGGGRVPEVTSPDMVSVQSIVGKKVMRNFSLLTQMMFTLNYFLKAFPDFLNFNQVMQVYGENVWDQPFVTTPFFVTSGLMFCSVWTGIKSVLCCLFLLVIWYRSIWC